MRRTYRSKKDTGGGVDHRDMVLSVDSKSSVFDAYYIQNIKLVKRELSCFGSSNNDTAPSYRARKRKYVKRLKEPEPLRESLSGSTYLTPDKSFRVNKTPDLFDQLLSSSPKLLSSKATKTSNIDMHNIVQPRMVKRTYCRKKLTRAKKFNNSSSEDTGSDKENSLSDDSIFNNTSNIKSHKLIIEKERVSSPLLLDDSINKIAMKFPPTIKLSKENTKRFSGGSPRFSNIFINDIQSPSLQMSPQCSTPFHEKYRGKSIYNFSPIPLNLIEDDIANNSVISNHKNDQSTSENNITSSMTNKETSKEIIDMNVSQNTKDEMLLVNKNAVIKSEIASSKDSFRNDPSLSNEMSPLCTTEIEPFLGFPSTSGRNSEYNVDETSLSNNVNTHEDITVNQAKSQQSICESIDNTNSRTVNCTQLNNESNNVIEDINNETASTVSEFEDIESLYDTCDSENISESSSSEQLKFKELKVTVERLNDSVFQMYHRRLLNNSLNNESTSDTNNNISDDNDIINNINESDYESFNDEDSQTNISGSSSNNIYQGNDIFKADNIGPIDVEIISSSENENSDSNDTETENNHVSFVTTRRRRRNEVSNDSILFNTTNSYNSVCSATLNMTVLNYSREKLDKTDLIDDTLVNNSNDENIYNDTSKAKECKPDVDELTNLPECVPSVDEKVIKINRRSTSRLFEESTCITSQIHADDTINGIRQGIVLKPGKKWERSLSIYRRMTTMGDSFNHSILDDESMKLKGRKYRQSVISTMEMQEHQGSVHNESVFSRRSTFVSKPRRSTIKIFKDPNVSSVSLSSSVLYDDLEGFLNGDCDDTIIELSKLSLGDSGHEVTVLDKFHDTSNRIVTARDYVLRRCNQTDLVLFDECYPDPVLKNCRKIGEGVYGEVYLWRAGDGRARVMKIVPIAGATRVNGEEQKDYHEIISEIVIAMELSALRAPIPEIERHLDDGKEIDALDLHSIQNATDVFNEVLAIRCVYGAYPSRLLDLWELYDECKGSENDNPAALPVDQQYIVLELANAGQDLESYQFNNAEQACALFKQIALGLAVAEEAFQFEHRDLHWGNVLIAPTDQKYATFVLRGRLHRTPRCGVAATLIDYSLSRAARDGRALYNDLADDDALFDAVGDYQFEVYRLMRDKLGNEWKNFEPYTNILWLHYTVDKMITALRYSRTNTKIHKHYIAKLKGIKNRVLDYGSATQFILTDNEF